MNRFLACLNHIYHHPIALLLRSRGGEIHEQTFEELLRIYQVDYKRHPLGSRRTPDFLVCGRPVELKSSQSDRVFLNDSFFKDDYLYIFSSGTPKETTSIIAMGRDLYSSAELKAYQRYHQELLQLRKSYSTIGEKTSTTEWKRSNEVSGEAPRLRLYPRSAIQFSVKGLDREELFLLAKKSLSK